VLPEVYAAQGSAVPENRKRLVRRLGELLVLVVGVLIAVSVVQIRSRPEASAGSPRQVAASFLSAHAEVLERVGAVARVEDMAPQRVSTGPAQELATYYLEVVGDRGTVRAEVEMKQGTDGTWHVHAATLFTDDGPIPLLEPVRCPTCSKV
jgi:hypothetical protein